MHYLNLSKTRRDFFKWAGAVGVFTPHILTSCKAPSVDTSRPAILIKETPQSNPTNDIKILQDALALEHKGIAAYTMGITSGLLDSNTISVAAKFKNHHEQHRDKLTSTLQKLGAQPVQTLKNYDLGPLTNQTDVLKLAASIEELAAFSYSQAAAELTDRGLIAAAISIVGAEAWHTAVLKSVLGEDPAPSAFLL